MTGLSSPFSAHWPAALRSSMPAYKGTQGGMHLHTCIVFGLGVYSHHIRDIEGDCRSQIGFGIRD